MTLLALNRKRTDDPLPPLALDTGWRGACAVAVPLGLAVALGFALGNEMVAGIALAGFAIAIAGAMLCAVISWRARPVLHRLVTSAHFVCWRYSEAEWAQHVANEKRAPSMTRWMFYFATAVIVITAIAGLIEASYRASVGLPAMRASDAIHFVIPMSIPICLLLAFGAICDMVVAWYRRAMRRDGRVAYIGLDALYFSGQIAYARLLTGWRVTWIDDDPPALQFEHFGYRNHQHFRIPVPAGREGEARTAFESVKRLWVLNDC